MIYTADVVTRHHVLPPGRGREFCSLPGIEERRLPAVSVTRTVFTIGKLSASQGFFGDSTVDFD